MTLLSGPRLHAGCTGGARELRRGDGPACRSLLLISGAFGASSAVWLVSLCPVSAGACRYQLARTRVPFPAGRDWPICRPQGAGELRAGELGAGQVRVGEIGVGEVGAGEVGPLALTGADAPAVNSTSSARESARRRSSRTATPSGGDAVLRAGRDPETCTGSSDPRLAALAPDVEGVQGSLPPVRPAPAARARSDPGS